MENKRHLATFGKNEINYDVWIKKNKTTRTSLVIQWLRIRLPTQGTRVRSLVQEDSTCLWAPRPMCHNDCNHWSLSAQEPTLWTRGATALRSPHSATGEQPLLATTRESPQTATETQCSQNKWVNKNNNADTILRFKRSASTDQQRCAHYDWEPSHFNTRSEWIWERLLSELKLELGEVQSRLGS